MAKKKSIFSRLKTAVKKYLAKRDSEYSKRMLTKIINHSMLMLWASYVLAWFDKIEIAESLSKTIVTSVIALGLGYFTKSGVENIHKNPKNMGNQAPVVIVEPESVSDTVNKNRDC